MPSHKRQAGFVVDQDLIVYEFIGRTSPLVELTAGTASMSLRRLIRSSLLTAVLDAFNEALKTGATTTRRGLSFNVGELEISPRVRVALCVP